MRRARALLFWLWGFANGVILAVSLGMLVLYCGAACSQLDTLDAYISSSGTVFVCNSGAACPESEEWCWNGAESELESLLGAECHEITLGERFWPALVGCAYCCGDGCGRGANAHCGAFCR